MSLLDIAPDTAARASVLWQLARQVTARRDLDDVLSETFRSLRPLVRFSGGSIQMLDDDGWIYPVAADPAVSAQVMAQRVPLGSSIAGRVILTEQPVYLPDATTLLANSGRQAPGGARCYFGVPLIVDGHAIGLLQVDDPEPDAWNDEQRAIFVAVAPIVAAAIQNARAHAREQAMRTRTEIIERRLSEAGKAVAAIRECVEIGDEQGLESELVRLEHVLRGNALWLRMAEGLPRQRVIAEN